MKKIILILVLFAFLYGCVENVPSEKADLNTSLDFVTDQNAGLVNSVDVNLFGVARLRNDVNMCDSITDSLIKSRCFIEFALDTNNFELCKKIEIVSLRANCEMHLLKISK